MVKNLDAHAGDLRDVGSIPGSGRSPGERNGNSLQHSCLGNLTNRGAQQAMVHGVTKSWTQRKRLSTHAHTGFRLRSKILGEVLAKGQETGVRVRDEGRNRKIKLERAQFIHHML